MKQVPQKFQSDAISSVLQFVAEMDKQLKQ